MTVELLYGVLACSLFSAGVYCVLRRSLVRLIIGLILLSQSINLVIFLTGGLVFGEPPIVSEAASALEGPHADPLPQALVLTAIVIGFGLLAFYLVLLKRIYMAVGTDDLDRMRGSGT